MNVSVYLYMSLCFSVRAVRECGRVRAWVWACVCEYVCVFVLAFMCVFVRMCADVSVFVCVCVSV